MTMTCAVPEKTLRDQARASNPRNSAWVSANAGSGKTHVLAQRVIRLLLDGNRPNRILCLTFTKAAAANMSDRVFRTLAKWSTLPDTELSEAIAATGESRPDRPEQLARARVLFAQALDSPGGLKTLTIHAFCEKLLHSAPFEANVPASFSVLDDQGKDELQTRAWHDVLSAAHDDISLAFALERIAQDVGPDVQRFVKRIFDKSALFRALDSDETRRELRLALGADPYDTVETVIRSIALGGLSPESWPEIADVLCSGSVNDNKLGAKFGAAYDHWTSGNLESTVRTLASIYRKKTDGNAAALVTKTLARAAPETVQALKAEQQRVLLLLDRLAAVQIADRTIALSVVMNRIQDRYEELKAIHQSVDFDDMIQRTSTLLSRSSASWLLKKLDGGIDHILLDEAQDTSAAQWNILERISEDFFSGEGQILRSRTVFAVGDEKQSIFSFQGARPELFASKRSSFAQRIHSSGGKLEQVDLYLSFRSAPGVLAAVDKVFARHERSRGLYGRQEHVPTIHEAWKRASPSVVELWDVIPTVDQEPNRDWRLPLDYRDEADPAVVSARRIANVIANWLRDGETVGAGAESRLMRPDDIMILVRRRDAFFEAMIRALKERDIPTAGSDRLALARHIAVLDLLAIARAALLPEDDLNLATVLKTPFFGLGDDDLIALAPDRRSSLWDELRSSQDPHHQSISAKIDNLSRLVCELTPFEFFARVLGPLGARRAILARLGPEASDVLDELLSLALAHERRTSPGMHVFISEVETSSGTIKRDLDNSEGQVRVMTIHAAKGLEAKIVFLPDVCSIPTNRSEMPVFELQTGTISGFPAWSPRKDQDCSRVAALRADSNESSLEEYRRLLYVAMTRAEERLYIAGHRGKNAHPPESWRQMLEDALSVEVIAGPASWDKEESILRFRSSSTLLRKEASITDQPHPMPIARPLWLETPAKAVQFSRLQVCSGIPGRENV
jgi:ATP-dependent helicase/nuclease subunit A